MNQHVHQRWVRAGWHRHRNRIGVTVDGCLSYCARLLKQAGGDALETGVAKGSCQFLEPMIKAVKANICQ